MLWVLLVSKANVFENCKTKLLPCNIPRFLFGRTLNMKLQLLLVEFN